MQHLPVERQLDSGNPDLELRPQDSCKSGVEIAPEAWVRLGPDKGKSPLRLSSRTASSCGQSAWPKPLGDRAWAGKGWLAHSCTRVRQADLLQRTSVESTHPARGMPEHCSYCAREMLSAIPAQKIAHHRFKKAETGPTLRRALDAMKISAIVIWSC